MEDTDTLDRAATMGNMAAQVPDDYRSLTVTADHLMDLAGKAVVKVVYSTETAQEALLAQIDYFGQHGLLRDPATIAMIHRGAEGPVAYVYTVSETQTNIIVDKSVFDRAFSREDLGNMSTMGTFASLVSLATEMVRAAKASGRDPSLLAFVPDF